MNREDAIAILDRRWAYAHPRHLCRFCLAPLADDDDHFCPSCWDRMCAQLWDEMYREPEIDA